MNKYLTIILTILAILLMTIVAALFVLWSLGKTSHGNFTVEELETIVHRSVNEFERRIEIADRDFLLNQAKQFFDEEVWNGKNGSIADDDLIESFKIELLLDYVHQQFIIAYPKLILPDGRWCYQNCQGIYARQKILLCSPTQYLCIWGTPLPQSGGSGYYGSASTSVENNFQGGMLNEGDVIICSSLQSADPESTLAAPRTYKFGDTSLLKPGRRRHYIMNRNCYMVSFGLHDGPMESPTSGSNLIKTLLPGVVWPYFFQNQDSKSFWIQIEDAAKAMCMWLKWRLSSRL